MIPLLFLPWFLSATPRNVYMYFLNIHTHRRKKSENIILCELHLSISRIHTIFYGLSNSLAANLCVLVINLWLVCRASCEFNQFSRDLGIDSFGDSVKIYLESENLFRERVTTIMRNNFRLLPFNNWVLIYLIMKSCDNME